MEAHEKTYLPKQSEQIIFAVETNNTNGLEANETGVEETEYSLEQDPMANSYDDQIGEAEYLEDDLADDIYTDDRKHVRPTTDAPDEDASDCLEPENKDVEIREEQTDEAKNEILDFEKSKPSFGNGNEKDRNIETRCGANKGEIVNEQQCRVCTSAEDLVSLFDKIEKSSPADMLMTICPSVSIATKDYMPQFICNHCLDNVTIALQLKIQLETTERDLRKKLSRSKNKIRRPKGYVVIDAPDSDPPSEEELNDDVEFKVSDEAISSPDSDSEDSDISGKKRRTLRGTASRRGRRKITAGVTQTASMARTIKRELSDSGSNHREALPQKTRKPINSYQEHIRSDLTCEVCSKSFKINRAYISHRAKHDSCPKCNRLFKNRTELRRHMIQNHSDTNLLYDCKKCMRSFNSDTRLRQHRMKECDPKKKKKSDFQAISLGKDLFKSVAPLTTTYWSDSFSD